VVELLLLLRLLRSRKELGLAYGNCGTDDGDIGSSQKQNPWKLLSLSLSLSPHDPRASQVDSNAISLPPPPAHLLVGQAETLSVSLQNPKTLKTPKPIKNPRLQNPGTLKGSLYIM